MVNIEKRLTRDGDEQRQTATFTLRFKTLPATSQKSLWLRYPQNHTKNGVSFAKLFSDYSKIIKAGINGTIQDYEVQAIMTANTPLGTTWKQIAYNNPDSSNRGLSKIFESYFAGSLCEKIWRRSDGAILWLRSKIIIRLELPAAHEYETKLKAEKEQKAGESVPQF